MGKSKRNRRTGGRVTPKAQSDTVVSQMFGKDYQKSGALGLLLAVAEFAGHCEEREGEEDSLPALGEALVRMLAEDPSKLSANALAAVAHTWPDQLVRSAAIDAGVNRERQVAGLLRTLDQTVLVDGWRVTHEYGDSRVMLFELSIGGRETLTLSAITDDYRRGWVELGLLRAPAKEAVGAFDAPEQPGSPRKVTEHLALPQLRFEAWLLTANRRVDSEHKADPIVLSWLARILDVDTEFPAMPDFSDLGMGTDDDEGIDVVEELEIFLRSDGGRVWSGEAYELLIDHLSDHESARASMRWSPARVEDFLLFRSHAEVEGVHALPALLRSWVKHCASAHRQRKPLLQAVLAEIDLCEPEFFEKYSDTHAA